MKPPSENNNAEGTDAFSGRRKRNKVTGSGPNKQLKPEDILTPRQLQSLLSDFSEPDRLNDGIRCFRAFLNRCSKSGEVSDEIVCLNLKILKEWLEAQSKRATDGDEGEGQGNAFGDFLQAWSYASQKNALSVLSLVVSSLASVVRICSQNEDLRASGFVLCKALLQQSYLKIIYRTLISNRDHVVAPCLRMLTEVNRFDHGSACGLVHSAFDFTVKDITRNLEVRGRKVDMKDDSRRPTIRTTFLRFIISFFQYGSSNVKSQILGLRNWISPMFKYLRSDSPMAINELLGALSKHIMDDKDIPRATKTAVFNEWVLGHITELYGRQEKVIISKVGKEEEKPIAEIAHEFLMNVCATPGNGICFSDSGWYPPGSTEGEEKRRGLGSPRVFNRTLSSFVSAIRPYSDTLQQDLLLAIFKACPELVASYFISNSSFSFDPKLTSTWIGYCGFLTATIELPIPGNFGLTELSPMPPPTSMIVENVIPMPLTKAVLTKCISHESSYNLIKFLTTRLLVVSFRKLRKVLSALDVASASMVDPSTNWSRARFDFVEEFCKRIPDMPTIVNLVKSSGQGMLQKEAASRLLADYFEILSEVAMAGNFDLTLALGDLFVTGEGLEGKNPQEEGLRFLEIRHLLKVAKGVPDIKWWHKPATLPFSPFVSILKVCCGPKSSFPLQQIKTLLHSFVAPSLLFQTETPASPLEALLESLSVIADPAAFEAVLGFLDESISRCIRTPFKYVDDYAEIAFDKGSSKQGEGTAAVSPLVMTIAERFKFFIESKASPEVKLGLSSWLARFMESCAILGEHGRVLLAICDRLVKFCEEEKASRGIFNSLRRELEAEEEFQIISRGSRASTPKKEKGIVTGGRHSRNLFRGLRNLDPDIIEGALEFHQGIGNEVSLFDIAVLCKAIGCVLNGPRIIEGDACATISKLLEILQTVLGRALREDELRARSKAMLAQDSVWVESFLHIPGSDRAPRYITFSTGFSRLLCFAFNKFEPSLEPIMQRLKSSVTDVTQFLTNNDTDDNEQKVLLVYEPIILQLLSLDNLLDLVDAILKSTSGKGLKELQCDLLRLILQRFSTEDERLPVQHLKDILAQIQKRLPDYEGFNSALGKYLSNSPEQNMDFLCAKLPFLDPKNDPSAGKLRLECALIRKVGVVREAVLSSLAKNSGSGKSRDISHYLIALLESFSVPANEGGRFEWIETTEAKTREQLDKIFGQFQERIYENPLSPEQVNILQRAASLFSSLDKEKALQKIIQDNRRSNLTAKTVGLIDSLIDSQETAGVRSWILMVFNFLTRRFAEDELLSERVLGFTKRLGELFSRGKIDLSTSAPRAALNAVLESGLQKHINIPEIVYFISVMVSQLPAKSLDAGKLLQMALGHSKNPLLFRGDAPDEISHHMVFVIYSLFLMAKSAQSTITTMDGVLGLYRGTNGIVDTALLNVIWHIEAHLAQSCANRIADWSILERAEGKPFISRARGRLFVSVDSKRLARSVLQYSPRKAVIFSADIITLELFTSAVAEQKEMDSQTYNPEFLLPALTYCLLSHNVIIDVQAAVGKHTLGFAIMGLSAYDKNMNKMACGYIRTVIAKLEASTYRERTQVLHLLCTLLVSFTSNEKSDPSKPSHIPTVMGVFLAQAVQVLSNPGHFLYGKVMELLLRQPLLHLHDVPHMLSLANVGEEYHKEVFWILNVLVAGLKTEKDLDLYRKRNVFGNCLNVYNSPYTSDKEKGKVIELLWNAAGIEGGGTTLITRNGIMSWVENQLTSSLSAGNRTLMKRLGARLFESSAKEHVKAWSKGNIEHHLRGILEG